MAIGGLISAVLSRFIFVLLDVYRAIQPASGTPVLSRSRTVIIGPARAGGSPGGLAANFQRKTHRRTRRGADVLDNKGVKRTRDAEEFYAMPNAHPENGGAHRREHRQFYLIISKLIRTDQDFAFGMRTVIDSVRHPLV